MPVRNFADLFAKSQEASDNSGGGFEPLQPGKYTFLIEDIPKVNDEKEFLSMKAKVAEGERQGVNVFHTIMFRENAPAFTLKWMFELMEAVGISAEALQSTGGDLSNIANALAGRTFTADVLLKPRKDANKQIVKNDDGTDKMQNELRNFGPASVSGAPGIPQPGAVPTNTPTTPQAGAQPVQSAPAPQPTNSFGAPPAPQAGGFTPPPPMPLGN